MHQWARKLVLPFFSPGAVRPYEEGTRALCHRLIDGFIDRGRADVAADYAQQIPVRVIAAMLGVDDSRSDEFVGWVRAILEQGHLDPLKRLEARTALLDFFARAGGRPAGQPARRRPHHRSSSRPRSTASRCPTATSSAPAT